MKHHSAFLLALVLLIPYCVNGLASDRDEIEKQLGLFFDDPAYHRALWAVKVQSVETGEILFEKNAEKYVMPASNMKLLTAVAAIERLGLNFKYQTVLATDGEVEDGILKGNLIVIGSGDPTLGARLSSPDRQSIDQGQPTAVFQEWADKLKEAGIREIRGDIIGDDSVFDDVPLGQGWTWDNLPYGYSAEIGGLQFNENYVVVWLIPAGEAGGTVEVRATPSTSFLKLENQLETIEAYEDWDYQVDREPGSNLAVLKGTVPAGHSPLRLTVSVDNPTAYFVTVLKETLQSSGIPVSGMPRDIDDLTDPPASQKTLYVHHSPDLRYIVRVLLKISQNLYAETLIRTLDGREVGKSFNEGKEEVQEVLTGIGIPSDAYVLADGSGLSRYSYLTANTLVRLLRHAYRAPYRDLFEEALPLAGVDGTIGRRLRGTAGEGNVRAKTGTLSNVRALSGYVTTRSGDTLAFSMIVNNYTQPRKSAEYLQDLALEYLANLGK
jgi:D-alanyl-D-alanine carboxypeptidase/D-alanyl-D-alanine-endopeptidase (penicillin-binding protein 4)